MIYSSISEIIGNTPILELKNNSQHRLLLKMEKFNPGYSMKDRMALNMLIQAEKDGLLNKNSTIIESSSGNTAIGVAMIAAEKGYKFIAVVDHHAASDKINIIESYGAEVIYVDSSRYAEDEVAVKAREELAKKLSKEINNSIFLQQADNLANSDGYYYTLGKELWYETNKKINILVGAVGTGGSLSGTARKIKEYNNKVEVIGVEPVGSVIFGGESKPYYQSGTGNPGNVSIGKNVNYSLIDEGIKVTDKEAFTTAIFLAKNKGILVGGASGGVIYSAIEKAFRVEKKINLNIVVIVADGGERYLDTVFNKEWIAKKNLYCKKIERKLIDWLL